MRRPFLIAGLLGIAALVLAYRISIPLEGHLFLCQSPFTLPVIALEFIGSIEELRLFFGEEGKEARLAAMQACINRDNFFIAGYSLFLMAIALTIWMRTRQNRYALLVLLAVGVGLADFFENDGMKTLISLLQEAPQSITEAHFSSLHFYTWSKWMGMAVFFLALIPFLWSARVPGKILAVAGGLTALLSLFAWFSDSWIQTYAAAVFLVFPLAVVFCFLFKKTRLSETPTGGNNAE